MAKIYTPSEFLKEKKLREIPVEKELLDKFKEALSNHLPSKPDEVPAYRRCLMTPSIKARTKSNRGRE